MSSLIYRASQHKKLHLISSLKRSCSIQLVNESNVVSKLSRVENFSYYHNYSELRISHNNLINSNIFHWNFLNQSRYVANKIHPPGSSYCTLRNFSSKKPGKNGEVVSTVSSTIVNDDRWKGSNRSKSENDSSNSDTKFTNSVLEDIRRDNEKRAKSKLYKREKVNTRLTKSDNQKKAVKQKNRNVSRRQNIKSSKQNDKAQSKGKQSEQSQIWNRRYEQLIAYKEKYGHTNVPPYNYSNQPVKYKLLGRWVSHQRAIYKKKKQSRDISKPNSLSFEMSDRFSKLENIGFVWDVHNKLWDDYYEELVEFKDKNGHANPPYLLAFDSSSSYRSLALWTNRQRDYWKRKQRGLKTPLSDEREEKLTQLGCNFNVRQMYGPWVKKFEELRDYKDKFGHVNVPLDLKHSVKDSKTEEGKDSNESSYIGLAKWVQRQRFAYQKWQKKNNSKSTQSTASVTSQNNDNSKRNAMNAEKINALEALGFVWGTLHDVRWFKMLKQLRQYKLKHGNCMVPQNYEVNPKLGLWVNHQRKQYEKIRNWEISENERKLALTTVESKSHVKSQKKLLDAKPRNFALTEERINLLNAEGFVWSLKETSLEESTEERLSDLRKFFKKNGHSCFPRVGKYKQLSLWVDWIRLKYERKNVGKHKNFNYVKENIDTDSEDNTNIESNLDLPAELVKELNKISFLWDIDDAQWWTDFYSFKKSLSKGMSKAMQNKYSMWIKLQKELIQKETCREPHTNTIVGSGEKLGECSNKAGPKILTKDKIHALQSLELPFEFKDILVETDQTISNHSRPGIVIGKESIVAAEETRQNHELRSWNEMFDSLKSFYAECGSSKVPSVYPRDPELGIWVLQQRERYHKRFNATDRVTQDVAINGSDIAGSISDEEILALNSLNFAWDTDNADWDEKYRNLIEFEKEYGHCEVPLWFSENPDLGSWIHEQRRELRAHYNGEKSSLSQLRQKLLEDAGIEAN